jgi:peptidoglycan/LPS O-acetylase OafA/YrhL
MIVLQAAMIKFLPPLGQRFHFLTLLFLTLLGTVGVSAASYRFVEAPAMQWGKRLAQRRHS